MDYGEYKKRRLRNEERLAVMQLDMLGRSFQDAVHVLEERLKNVKGVKRDVGMMKHICKRLVHEALNTDPGVPEEIAAQIVRQSRDFRFGLERIAPVRKMEECVMTLEDEWKLIHIALDSRCSICLKMGEECKRCGVRALLRKFVDEPEPDIMTGCGYQGCGLSDSKKLNKQERL